MDKTWLEMIDAARAVRHDRQVSAYISAGGVAAAVLTESGQIYTGVCVDTSCTLGICAERNAIFNMLTRGEHRIRRVVAIGGKKILPPCGACRELLAQLMPDDFAEIEILMDMQGRTVPLGKLTPEWWI